MYKWLLPKVGRGEKQILLRANRFAELAATGAERRSRPRTAARRDPVRDRVEAWSASALRRLILRA